MFIMHILQKTIGSYSFTFILFKWKLKLGVSEAATGGVL